MSLPLIQLTHLQELFYELGMLCWLFCAGLTLSIYQG